MGICGSIATGLFANTIFNCEAGLFYGNPNQLVTQVIAVRITIVFSLVGTIVRYKITQLLTRGTRVDEAIELKGIDAAYHNEKSFS